MTADHYHSCKILRGGTVTWRHNECEKRLAWLVEQSGARAVRQPNLPDTNLSLSHRLALAAGEQEEEETKLRPDLLVQGRLPETECMIDVAVVHPSSPSYIKNGKTGKYAPEREKDKHAKYRLKVRKAGYTFRAFVLESYGGWGDEATEFLRLLSYEHSQKEEEQTAFFVRAKAVMSFALQRGNAEVMGTGTLHTQTKTKPKPLRFQHSRD